MVDISDVVKCTDINKVYRLDKPTIKYVSPANKIAAKHDGCMGIQELMNKFGKIYGWKVHSNHWNAKDKSFYLTVMNNSEIVGDKHFSYEDICKEMWWHSFEIIGPDTIRPKPFTFDEKEAAVKPALEATAKRDAAAKKSETMEVQETA